MVRAMTTSLNPAQRRVFELLRRPGVGDGAAPVPAGLAEGLAARLEGALADVVGHLGGERLVVTKHDLARIHTCERHYLGTRPRFEWTPRTARGSLVHKAIQLTLNWQGEPHPSELVDEALARLVDDDSSLADWLGGLTEGVRADLRSEAVDLVSVFQECFPPLEASWRPVTETPVRVELFDGLVRLTGRVDLTLGRAAGDEPRKVIIDLKTGAPAIHHRDDLRYYALLETIRMGVPPRLVASYYLDAARGRDRRRHRGAPRRRLGPHHRRHTEAGRGAAGPARRQRHTGPGLRLVPAARRLLGGRRLLEGTRGGAMSEGTAQPSDSGLMSATGTASPAAERRVEIIRPGCTAVWGSVMRSPRNASASDSEITVNATPKNRAPPLSASGVGAPTTSSTTSPMRKKACRTGRP